MDIQNPTADQMTPPEFWPDYLRDADVQKVMRLAAACGQWNRDRLIDLQIGGETPVHVATAAFDLTHEHHGSIMDLLIDGRLGSALALLRPCFEAFVRGLWLVRGSDATQFQHFEGGRDSKTVEQLLGDIKRKAKAGGEDVFLLETWKLSKDSLHQYTHTSYQLLVRRMDEELLETPIPHSEVADAIRFATATAMLASVEIAKLGKSTALEKEALRFLGVLYPPQATGPT